MSHTSAIEKVTELEANLQVAQTREEIALALPRVVRAPEDMEKKTRRQVTARGHARRI